MTSRRSCKISSDCSRDRDWCRDSSTSNLCVWVCVCEGGRVKGTMVDIVSLRIYLCCS